MTLGLRSGRRIASASADLAQAEVASNLLELWKGGNQRLYNILGDARGRVGELDYQHSLSGPGAFMQGFTEPTEFARHLTSVRPLDRLTGAALRTLVDRSVATNELGRAVVGATYKYGLPAVQRNPGLVRALLPDALTATDDLVGRQVSDYARKLDEVDTPETQVMKLANRPEPLKRLDELDEEFGQILLDLAKEGYISRLDPLETVSRVDLLAQRATPGVRAVDLARLPGSPRPASVLIASAIGEAFIEGISEVPVYRAIADSKRFITPDNIRGIIPSQYLETDTILTPRMKGIVKEYQEIQKTAPESDDMPLVQVVSKIDEALKAYIEENIPETEILVRSALNAGADSTPGQYARAIKQALARGVPLASTRPNTPLSLIHISEPTRPY